MGGENVRAQGSDVVAGQVVLPAGTVISALGGGERYARLPGSFGGESIPQTRIAILSTGNELVDPSPKPPPSQTGTDWGFSVFDANRPSLRTALTALYSPHLDLGNHPRQSLLTPSPPSIAALAQADILLTTAARAWVNPTSSNLSSNETSRQPSLWPCRYETGQATTSPRCRRTKSYSPSRAIQRQHW